MVHGSVMADVAVHVRDYDDIRIVILMCANTNPHVRKTDTRICATVTTINERRSMRVNALDEQARLCAQCIARVSISRQCRGCSSISSIHVDSRVFTDNLIAVRRQATLTLQMSWQTAAESEQNVRSPEKKTFW